MKDKEIEATTTYNQAVSFDQLGGVGGLEEGGKGRTRSRTLSVPKRLLQDFGKWCLGGKGLGEEDCEL